MLALDGAERAVFSWRLARSVSNLGLPVKLIDFDFEGQALSQRIQGPGRQPGVSDLLRWGGPTEEFFASFPETRIQFAPAGTLLRVDPEGVQQNTLSELFAPPGQQGLTLVDADFSSPLHLVAARVEAVLLLSHQDRVLTPLQEEVLLALRQSRLPIWGIAQGSSGVFPYL